ncbi:hypothetical protein KQX54_005901 [Cotesia glomerata]|uniref:Uncharacterized protein n=1 Tax=Cotesia glomerata TaxID=32391 RepID=A0AAV7J099_COTGL|nr:hypothetical protein KQX54_005901 [Cotesia glomerata]
MLCSCEYNCLTRYENPDAEIRRKIENFPKMLTALKYYHGKLNFVKARIKNGDNSQELRKKLKAYGGKKLIHLIMIHLIIKYLEKCTYASQWIKTEDQGRIYFEVRKKNEGLIDEIAALSEEDLKKLMKILMDKYIEIHKIMC